MEEPGRSSDSGLPPPRPSQPRGQWRFRGERFPSQRRDRPGLAPGSLTGLRLWSRSLSSCGCRSPLRLWLPVVLVGGPHLRPLGGTRSRHRPGQLGPRPAQARARRRVRHPRRAAPAGARTRGCRRSPLGVAYAASDELHQHFVPGRRGAPLDVLIDAVGVAVGVLAWRRFGQRGIAVSVAIDLDVLGDTRPLWRDWLDGRRPRARRRAACPEDRAAAAAELDARGAGNWRTLLERFAEDRAPVYLRPAADVSAALRSLAGGRAEIVVVHRRSARARARRARDSSARPAGSSGVERARRPRRGRRRQDAGGAACAA